MSHTVIVYHSGYGHTRKQAEAVHKGAAGIAGAPPMQTGWASMRVGSIIYFIPFFFVLNPAFVLQGPWYESLYLTLSAGIGSIFICGGLQGYQLFIGDLRGSGRMQWPIRLLLIIAGFLLAVPGGGIMPWSHEQMAWVAVATLAPTLAFLGLFLVAYGLFARTYPMVSPRLAMIALEREAGH